MRAGGATGAGSQYRSQQETGMSWNQRDAGYGGGGYSRSQARDRDMGMQRGYGGMEAQLRLERERAMADRAATERVMAERAAAEEAYFRRQQAERIFRERELVAAPPRFAEPRREPRREVAMGFNKRKERTERWRQKGKLATASKGPVVKAKPKGKLQPRKPKEMRAAKKPKPMKKLLPNRKPKLSLDSALSASREPKDKSKKDAVRLDAPLSASRAGPVLKEAPADIGEIDVLPVAGEHGGWPEVYVDCHFRAKYGLSKFLSTALFMVEQQLDLGMCSFIFPPVGDSEEGFVCHVCYGSGDSMRSYSSAKADNKVDARKEAVNNFLKKTLEDYGGEEDQLKELFQKEQEKNKVDPEADDDEENIGKGLNKILKTSKLKYRLNGGKKGPIPDWGSIVNNWSQGYNNQNKVKRSIKFDGQEHIANVEVVLTEENQKKHGLPQVITIDVRDGSQKEAKQQSAYTVCKLLFPDCTLYKDVRAKLEAWKQEKREKKAKRKAQEEGLEEESDSKKAKTEEEDTDMQEEATPDEKEKDEVKDEEQDEEAEDEEAPETPAKPKTPKVDFGILTVAKLKQECKARDLSTAGVKAVLIQRLEEAVADQEAQEEAQEEEPSSTQGRFDKILSSVFGTDESKKVAIRLGVEEDSDAIVSLMQASLESEESSTDHITAEALVEDILSGTNPLAYVVLAEKDDEAVGYAIFNFEFSLRHGKVVRLMNVHVEGNEENEGIQTDLLTKIAILVKDAGCTALIWDNATDEKVFGAFGLDAQGEKVDSSAFLVELESLSQFLEQSGSDEL